MPTTALPEPTALPTGSRMPYSRNPLFVSRVPDLLKLAAALKGGETVAIGQTAAATGLGGIGKTQLASEFVHRYGQFFAGGVFWLSFADAAAVPAEVVACGGPKHMDLPGFSTLEFADQVGRVQREWESDIPRLLIFDNCEDEALLAEWQPKAGACRVLVTSRRAVWANTLGVHTLPLGVLAREESIDLLRKFRPDLSDTDADALAEELGDLPLALHLAGSYLQNYADHPRLGNPQHYLVKSREKRFEHTSMQGKSDEVSPTDHDLHVRATFALSYERLDTR